MEGRPAGRGRGRARGGGFVEPGQAQPVPEPAPAPAAVPVAEVVAPVEEIAERLETVAVESGRDVSAAAHRPGSGRSRGRAIPVRVEPVAPGRPVGVPAQSVPEEPEVVARMIAPVEEPPLQPPEPAVVEQVTAVEQPSGQPPEAAQQMEVQEPRAAASAEGSREGAAAPTAQGSDSYTYIHMKKDLEPVTRRGEKGDKIKVATNFIRVKVGPRRGIFEYRVEFDPPTEAYDLRKKSIRQCTWLKEKPYTFDGQTIYLSEALSTEVTKVEIRNPNDESLPMTLIFKFIKQSTLLESVHFYNILIKRIQSALGRVELGNNFYDLRTTHQIPQHKLEIFPGVVTRIDEVEGGLMLCLDASHKVIRRDTALDLWNALKKDGKPGAQDRYKEFMSSKMVLADYGGNKVYRVDDVTFDINPTHTFDRRGEPVTYVQYYKEQYGLTIKDLTQPLLVCKQRPRRSDKPGEIRFLTLVPEFCRMSGLSDEQIRDFRVMKDVAQFTRLTPQQRITTLIEFIKKVKSCAEAKKILDDWGLEFEDGLLHLEGRLIAPPNLEFNPRLTLKPGKPDFGREATSNACYRPVGLRRFGVVCTQKDRQTAETLLSLYKQVCSSLGINFGPAGEVVTVKGNNPNDFRATLADYAHPERVQFVIVLMPFPRDDVYSAIKRFCVVERAIPSQVILTKTLKNEKNQRSVMQKVALQINCKLGGALWSLKIPLNTRIMFVGMDIYHDPSRKKPSVMALVASMDTTCTKYFSKVIFQKPHQESSVESLISVFVNAMEEYRDANGAFPDRIIVFRDGVSDGQWDHVKATEVKQMKDGIKLTCPESEVSFTFCVVQKKINERFFTCRGSGYENPAPGSVLDHTVTRRYNYDFFLVPQLVRQGTVSPTHFVVLDETVETKPDLMQKFAFATTFMYYNWCGTIRVPAMCQYAHKLAYLTGQYLNAEPNGAHSRTLYYL